PDFSHEPQVRGARPGPQPLSVAGLFHAQNRRRRTMQGHIYRRRRTDGSWSNWYAVIDLPRQEGGRRRQRTTSHPTRREAQAWLARTAGTTARTSSNGQITLGEFLESWLAGKNGLRPSTRLSYRGHLHTYLIPQ